MNDVINGVVAALADPRWDVGDHEFPKNAGWETDQFTGQFTPFMVVYFSGGTEISGSFRDPESEKRVAVTINMFGILREQVTMMADVVRPIMKDLNQTNFGGTFVQNALLTSLGNVQRNDEFDKPMFIITDRFTLFTTKV